MDKTVWINRGQWPVYVGFCPSEKAWKATMRRMGVKNCEYPATDGHASFFDSNEGKNCAIITIADKDVDDLSRIGLLCHEVVHVVDYIFEVAGETSPGGETRAYLTQYIFQEIVDAFSRTREKKRSSEA